MAKRFCVFGWIFGAFFFLYAILALLALHLVSFIATLLIGFLLFPYGLTWIHQLFHIKLTNIKRWIIIAIIAAIALTLFYTLGQYNPYWG